MISSILKSLSSAFVITRQHFGLHRHDHGDLRRAGVTMVSLFSTSITSSATQNDTRRATYLSEAGTRYAMSELLTGDFSDTTINNLNGTNTLSTRRENFG